MLSTSHPGESKSYIRWRNENIHTSYHFVSKLDLILWCKYAECKVVTVISKFKKDAYQHLFVIVFLIRRNTDQTFDWQPLQYRVIVGMLSTEKHYNVDTIKSLLFSFWANFFFLSELSVTCSMFRFPEWRTKVGEKWRLRWWPFDRRVRFFDNLIDKNV